MSDESKIAALGCIVCRREGLGSTPAEIHHARGPAGMGQKSDMLIPLCAWHHRLGGYGNAFHAGPEVFKHRFGSELELAECARRLLPDE